MIGRAYLWGLAANGQAGVENVLDILRGGIDSALLGLGRSSVTELTRDDVVIPPISPAPWAADHAARSSAGGRVRGGLECLTGGGPAGQRDAAGQRRPEVGLRGAPPPGPARRRAQAASNPSRHECSRVRPAPA